MSGFIFQVLGRPLHKYDPVDFSIGEEIYENCCLPSLALYDHKSEEADWEIVFLVPESLVSFFANNKKNALDLLENKEYFKAKVKEEILGEHIGDRPYIVKVMESIGEYPDKVSNNKEPDYTITFQNSVENSIINTFFDLIELCNRYSNIKLIYDISTGQNVYVTTFMNALRDYITFRKLGYQCQDPTHTLSAWLSSSDPYNRNIEKFNIELRTLNVKAFFALPTLKGRPNPSLGAFLKETKRIPTILSTIPQKAEEKLEKLKTLQEKLRKSFHAIRFNVPLTFTYAEDLFDFEKFIEEKSTKNRKENPQKFKKELLQTVEKRILQKKEQLKELVNILEQEKLIEKDDRVIIERNAINSSEIKNFTFSLNMLEDLLKIWIKKIYNPTEEGKKLKNLEDTFVDLYERLGIGLNKKFLLRDCKKINKYASSLHEGERKSLDTLKAKQYDPQTITNKNEKNENNNQRKTGDTSRNFFAHSGFLQNIVWIENRADEIWVGYKTDHQQYKEIPEWLKSP